MEENNRILIIDDDPGVRDAYQTILGRHGADKRVTEMAALFDPPGQEPESVAQMNYDLSLACNGEEGVSAVQEAVEQGLPFAAAFVDMKMPGMDGAETSKRMTSIDPDIKIVIVTAYSEYTPEDIIRTTGRDDIFYLRKPFNSDEIRQFARALAKQWNLERERRRLHHELTQANELLEARVYARTAELHEANRRLAALDRDKMTFLRYLSHEMNTPLNWVGAAEIIEPEDLSEEDREVLEMVKKGFDRLNDLVKAVLSYFELAGSGINVKLENIPLSELISDIIIQKGDAIKAAGVEVVTDLGEGPGIAADPEYLTELLLILLDNAIAFSGAGGTITIRSEKSEGKNRLTIADEGRGIENRLLEEIFEPFAVEACHRREGGCGLSLPAAKIIAEAHGWRIRAESEGKGCGTRLILETGDIFDRGLSHDEKQ